VKSLQEGRVREGMRSLPVFGRRGTQKSDVYKACHSRRGSMFGENSGAGYPLRKGDKGNGDGAADARFRIKKKRTCSGKERSRCGRELKNVKERRGEVTKRGVEGHNRRGAHLRRGWSNNGVIADSPSRLDWGKSHGSSC